MQRCSASSTTPTPLGCELVLEPVGDLLGQPLLHLQAAGEQLDDPGELRQPEDAVAREVADVGDALEREQVVLAERVERDVAGEDELVVALVVGEGREVERPGREQLGVGGRRPAEGCRRVCSSSGPGRGRASRSATARSAAGRGRSGAAPSTSWRWRRATRSVRWRSCGLRLRGRCLRDRGVAWRCRDRNRSGCGRGGARPRRASVRWRRGPG